MAKIQSVEMEFDRNVFVNCPFDEEYYPLLKTLLFTIKKLGLNPRIALESSDSGKGRFAKIIEIIKSSKYSIHDLSRSQAKESGEFYRLNMPFELGIDFGCRYLSVEAKFEKKKFLILEKEKYSVQKALSDLNFADCKHYNGDADELVFQVRTWFAENGIDNVPDGSKIWDDYNVFFTNLYEKKIGEGSKKKDIDRMSIVEFMKYIDEALSSQTKMALQKLG